MVSKTDAISPHFVAEIRDLLLHARQKAYHTVNALMVETYWKIGQRIVEEEQQGKDRADYGHFLIKNLAIQLTHELGKGFAVANLKNFRQFYLTFPHREKGYALRSGLA